MLESINRNFGFAVDAIRIIFHYQFVQAGVFRLGIVDYQAAFTVLRDDLSIFTAVHERDVVEVPFELRKLAVDVGREFECRALCESLRAGACEPGQLVAVVVLLLLVEALRMVQLAAPLIFVLRLNVTALVHLLGASIFRLFSDIIAVIFAAEPHAKPAGVFAGTIFGSHLVATAVGVSNRIDNRHLARSVVFVLYAIAVHAIWQNLEIVLKPLDFRPRIAANMAVEYELVGALDVLVYKMRKGS